MAFKSGFFCTHNRIWKNTKIAENWVFWIFSWVFLKAYLVKRSEKPGFWDFFSWVFRKLGENLSFFRLEFFLKCTKKKACFYLYALGDDDVLAPIPFSSSLSLCGICSRTSTSFICGTVIKRIGSFPLFIQIYVTHTKYYIIMFLRAYY